MTHTLHYFQPHQSGLASSRSSVVTSCRGQDRQVPSTPKKIKLNNETPQNVAAAEQMSKYRKPLFVDTSTEYNLPSDLLPPKDSMSLLMVHPGYYEALRQSRARDHRFEVNMPCRVSKRSPKTDKPKRPMPPLIPASCDNTAPILPPRRQVVEPPPSVLPSRRLRSDHVPSRKHPETLSRTYSFDNRPMPHYRRQSHQEPFHNSHHRPHHHQHVEPVVPQIRTHPQPEVPRYGESSLKRSIQNGVTLTSDNAVFQNGNTTFTCGRKLSNKELELQQGQGRLQQQTQGSYWTIENGSSPPLLPPLAALTLAHKSSSGSGNTSDHDSGFCTPQNLTGDMDYSQQYPWHQDPAPPYNTNGKLTTLQNGTQVSKLFHWARGGGEEF